MFNWMREALPKRNWQSNGNDKQGIFRLELR
jgi:hypothetical protein